MTEEKLPLQLRPPKKIWEIDGSFKCAMIGTCLSRGELRKLSKEKIFAVEAGLDDYQLHAKFIRITDQCDQKSKSLNKYLEKKYRSLTRKYRLVAEDEAIRAIWAEDLIAGRLDSGWWAVVTHPRISISLLAECYGQVHMLGHDYVTHFEKKQKLLREQKEKLQAYEDLLSSERQIYLQEQRRMQKEMAALKSTIDKQVAVIREQEVLLEEPAKGSVMAVGVEGGFREDEVREILAELRHTNERLSVKIDVLNEELDFSRDLHNDSMAELDGLKAHNAELRQKEAAQAQEIVSLEAYILQYMEKENPCLSCAGQCPEDCPGLDLCGRTVLYVGGLHKMVPHYRQLVENLGGSFIHHDGGKEEARNLLPKMLSTADAVLCPIDCVSHDACNCVKKICKRYRKPLVLMRSASLSSLAKGLGDIAV